MTKDVILIAISVWLLFGGCLVANHSIVVGVVNRGRLPAGVSELLAYILAITIGPALWLYVLVTGKDA